MGCCGDWNPWNWRGIVKDVSTVDTKPNEFDRVTLTIVAHKLPKSRFSPFSDFCQKIELVEKIAEIVEESIHLLHLLKAITNPSIYQLLNKLHDSAHTIEGLLHPFCLLSDISKILNGQFLDKKWSNTAARICYAISHLFSFAHFAHKHQLIQLNSDYKKYIKLAPAFSAAGHGIRVITLLWNKIKVKHHKHASHVKHENEFFSNMCIHLGGAISDGWCAVRKIESLKPLIPTMTVIAAVSTLAHAWFCANRLMPNDKIEVKAQLILDEAIKKKLDIRPNNTIDLNKTFEFENK